jgi:hypothetical protein
MKVTIMATKEPKPARIKHRVLGLSNGHVIDGVPSKITHTAYYFSYPQAIITDDASKCSIDGLLRVNKCEVVWESVCEGDDE